MKKILLMAICMIASVGVYAQKDAKAMAILEKASANYNSYSTIKADFTITIENLVDETKSSQTGSIITKKSKYVLNMDGQQIISNGNDVWTYMEDINEVQIDVVSDDEGSISPVNFFTMYEKGYKYVYIGEATHNSKACHQIDLVPEDDEQTFFKINLFVDISTNLISGAKILDKGGSHFYYTINKFKSNVPTEDSAFEFDVNKHSDIEVIDLR
ncbi:MAG: outer membrane lipoprotein carrier protein LolA [Bacteroidia bacterium]|nr:outer membrane lipoprotein carrier protein LolA [Bacteroidia bacterium]